MPIWSVARSIDGPTHRGLPLGAGSIQVRATVLRLGNFLWLGPLCPRWHRVWLMFRPRRGAPAARRAIEMLVSVAAATVGEQEGPYGQAAVASGVGVGEAGSQEEAATTASALDVISRGVLPRANRRREDIVVWRPIVEVELCLMPVVHTMSG